MRPDGMGALPLSWTEIEAWARVTQTPLSPWDAAVLRDLSAEYAAEHYRAEDPLCPPPWADRTAPKPTLTEVKAVMDQIVAAPTKGGRKRVRK